MQQRSNSSWLKNPNIYVGIITLSIALIGAYLVKRVNKKTKYQPTFFKLNNNIIEIISRHQPILEVCAGNGSNAKRLWDHGIDILAFDGMPYLVPQQPNLVTAGWNGTFEDKYPGHTLLILCGGGIKDSISKYTGQKVILGGYYNPETQKSSLTCHTEWMVKQKWVLIDQAINVTGCKTHHDSGQEYSEGFIINVYQRCSSLD